MNGTIPKEEFKEKLDSGEYVLIDVRTQKEYDEKHIDGSEVIDIQQSNFLEKINKLDKDKKYLVYCGVGGRSNKALNQMVNEGFNEVYDLDGGMSNYF